jgi:phthiocerol/phenolphthiocerol synthesis type-I polyketide synthase E
LQANETSNLAGIAIIGMSGRFPGANTIDKLWQNLVGGVETISRFREEELEFSIGSEAEKAQGQKFVRARSILENVDLFDAAFFGINPREAEVMDPQHRLLLECAWESLETAGYDPDQYAGLIGVYAGCSLNSYLLYNLCQNRAFTEKFAGSYQVGLYSILLGNEKDFLATRLSYKLNLKGPSMTIQSACSTSLVAVCQACTSLLTYQCDMALAGGVSISFPQKRDYLYQEGSLVSGDGTCRAFDAGADGTVFGHGVAVVLLKRLADAVADGDTVLAVIKGSAVNNDGSVKVSYAAPSVEAQASVIAMAQAVADVHPESISYVEAHGTGTPLGDPIEMAALTKAFRGGGAKGNGYCALGTGKTYFGHLDAAAGATGLIKTVLQLQHGKIPPLLHFKSPNPKIDFARSPFFPVDKLMDWKRGENPLRAGVSAFGVGGTNAHVIVEEAPVIESSGGSRPQQLLLLSARSEAALNKATENLAEHLAKNPGQNLADVCFTLHKGRKHFPYSRALVAVDTADAVAKLTSGSSKFIFSKKTPQNEPSVVFLFPGQGTQFVGMGRDVYENERVYRLEVDRCAEILKAPLGLDIRSVLYPDAGSLATAEKQLNETVIAQPALFVVEYALAKLWMSWGIKPSVLIGHSIGEYVAAVLAGTFALADALALVSARGRLIQALPGGSMLAVRLEGAAVEPLLPAGASIAAFNSSTLSTVSGPTEVLQTFSEMLEEKGIAARFLNTSHAFHSAMVEPMLPEFVEIIRRTPWQPPQIPWVSTCTGGWMTSGELADSTYWARQIREAVRFTDALKQVIGEPGRILLEVGPGQILGRLASQHPAKTADMTVLASLDAGNSPEAGLAAMLGTLGRLWIAGLKPDWQGFYADEKRKRVPLPTYPFERERFWVEPGAAVGGTNGSASVSHVLDDARKSGACPPVLIEQVIHEQLRLMTQQLDMLQNPEAVPAATDGDGKQQSN